MASVTRFSRRAEGYNTAVPGRSTGTQQMRSRPSVPKLDHAAAEGGGGGGGRGPIGRTSTNMSNNKRMLETTTPAEARDYNDIKTKKARIAIDIYAPARNKQSNSGNGAHAASTPKSTSTVGAPPTPEEMPSTKGITTKPTDNALESAGIGGRDVKAQQDQNLTKHQAKVINGIKHELDRLQPEGVTAAPIAKEQGRKLRSQEATRFKSELAAYFPEYDEVIGNEPKEEYLFTADTPIVVYDTGIAGNSAPQSQTLYNSLAPVRGYGDALYTDVVDSQRIDFSFLEAQFKNKITEDPLPDSAYEKVHKRAERLERNIRNTEKGRAQHEKDQIIRLLEGLQGHDWLRVMGVSGVTETKKKTFEPARQHFIQGCQAILDKFRNWGIEEKRRKLERERLLAEEAQEEEDEEDSDAEADDEGSAGRLGDDDSSLGESEASSPAKQLREEAMARSRLLDKGTKRPRPTARPPPLRPPLPPAPPKEFKSFYAKRYERDSAINRTRRAGRKILAWGLPVPDFPQQDFNLPEEYRDEETLKTRARKKRRDKRGSTRG